MEAVFHSIIIILSFGLIFIFAMFIEHKILIKQGQKGYDLFETLANVASAFLYKSTDGLYLILFFGTLSGMVANQGLNIDFEYHWYTYLCIFIFQDLMFYFFHLFSHKFRFGWVSHKIHHSSTHFNFGVALRQSLLAPIPFVGISVIIWLPFVFLGLDVTVVAFIYELNLLYQFFIHTKAIKRYPKWIEIIFNTPSHHRVHHGCLESQIDCNYGGVFIIWDRLFGTFRDESTVGEIIYGVKSRPVSTNNVFILIFEELFDLIATVWKEKNILVLFRHPDHDANKLSEKAK